MRPEILNPLFSPLTSLKGIGSQYLRLISALCNGSRAADLLWHLPSSIVDRRYGAPLNEAKAGNIWTGLIRVIRHEEPKSRKQPYRIEVEDETGSLTLNFFKWYPGVLKKNLPENGLRVISGKLESFNGHLQMNHPDYIGLSDSLEKLQSIEPIYPLCAGVSNKLVLRVMSEALARLPHLPEWQDASFVKQQNFPSWYEALYQAHKPQSIADTLPQVPARRRLAYDELLADQLALAMVRARNKKQAGHVLAGDGHLRRRFLEILEFELTNAQKRVLKEIAADMAQPYTMLRLLQGDVGSGKTAVAFMCMLNAVECRRQAALMAPTEILAKQHFDTLSVWAGALGIKIALLTGAIKGKKRMLLLEKLASGKIDILIGTHALFTQSVSFSNLAFVVIDEQHRFGVNQRLSLSAKGDRPDILVMTATPIPRTLVLTQYGDMDYSQIDELPKGRLPVDTRVVPLSKSDEVVAGLKRKIESGSRAYWVCPLVEETQKSDLAAARHRFETLCQIFGAENVGLVHGKMKDKEKDAVMERFKEGVIKLLVATTVIEVGVNVPEATVMIIEHAEHFGLAQLHQLRGRIKRGYEASTCILLYGAPLSETARERLNIMKKSEDGFLIAEKDLELRGGGEILGTRQSGFENFRLAQLPEHKDLLFAAHKDAELVLNMDKNLQTPRGQALRLLLYLFEKDETTKTYKAG